MKILKVLSKIVIEVRKISDKDLIENLKKKDKKALDILVEKYSNLIFKIAYSVLNNRQLSEECVNDVLLKVWDSINSFNRNEDKFKCWIMAIAKYTAIDLLRKEKKHYDNNLLDENISKEGLLVEEALEVKETRQLIISEIKKMDDVNKQIFIKKFFFMEPIKNIGQALGLSDSAVSNRLLREKKKLKVTLEKEGII